MLCYVIIKPLTYIFNSSLSKRVFPVKMKLGKILPIYKKGKQNDVTNYKPISVLT